MAGDTEELAGAITRLYNDRKKYASLEKGARGIAKEFSVAAISKRLEKIIKEVEG